MAEQQDYDQDPQQDQQHDQQQEEQPQRRRKLTNAEWGKGSYPAYERKGPRYSQDQLTLSLDDLGRKHYHTPEGRKVCGRLKIAKNRTVENEACLCPGMVSGPCRIHGGRAGRPVSSGRYSRVLKRWRVDFQRALNDKHLLDARRDIAMMDVAISKLSERAEEHDCPGWRGQVKQTYERLNEAIRNKRQRDVGPLLQALGELIEGGAREDQVMGELVAQLDRRANRAQRATEIEMKREEKVSLSSIAAVFESWLQVLERQLEPRVYAMLVPALRQVTTMEALSAPALLPRTTQTPVALEE